MSATLLLKTLGEYTFLSNTVSEVSCPISYMDTVIGFSAHLNPVRSHFSYLKDICKVPISKLGHIVRFRGLEIIGRTVFNPPWEGRVVGPKGLENA